MFYTSPGGHNWGALNLDSLAVLYICVAAVWTIVVLIGQALIVHFRNVGYVRMRNVLLLVASTLALHVYLVMVLLVYPLNGTFGCSAEYWIMSIYLPIGIALFQLENILLYSVSRVQEQAIRPRPRPNAAKLSLWQKYNGMNIFDRAKWLVVAGLALQFIVTLAIYLVSRKFNTYGITSQAVSAAECRRGWEWAPSITWQLLWAWCFGPFILFKIRRIHDIHYWKLQTIVAMVASMPGAPLWIMATYSGTLTSVNTYWVAPMWFAPGLMTMEFVTLFFPLLEVYQQRPWHSRVAAKDCSQKSLHSRSSISDSDTSRQPAGSKRNGDAMEALNHALRNPSEFAHLLDFAVHRDFTSENITFLKAVQEFDDLWNQLGGESMTQASKDDCFAFASYIYVTYVEPKGPSPINISGPMRRRLDAVFKATAGLLPPPPAEDVVAPFWGKNNGFDLRVLPVGGPRSASQERIVPHSSEYTKYQNAGHLSLLQNSNIPHNFHKLVFKEAEESIKECVIQNTWTRFIDSYETMSMASSEGSKSLSSSKSFLSSIWSKS